MLFFFAPGAGLKEKLLLFRSGIFHAADFIFSRGGPKSSYCWGKMSSGSSVWGWLLFLGQTAKKKCCGIPQCSAFCGYTFLSFFLSWKEEAPKRFSSSLCIFYSISPSSFFLLWSRSCRDSSLCILFSSVVVVLFLGRFCRCHPDEWHTHTQQRGHNLCEIFLTCCSSSSLSFPIEETPLVF